MNQLLSVFFALAAVVGGVGMILLVLGACASAILDGDSSDPVS